MTITLHERGVGENIALLVRILWENLGKLILIALLFTLPGLIPDILSEMDPNTGKGHSSDYTILINFLLYPLMMGSIVGVVVGSYTGEKVSMWKSMALAFGRWIPLVLFGLVYCLGIGLGIVLLIIPGYMFLAAFYLGLPAIVIEHLGVRSAFKRSTFLTRGLRRDVVASVLILGVLVSVPAATTYYLMNLVGHFDTSVGLDSLAITSLLIRWTYRSFLSILCAIVSVMFYFQARGTKEHYSLVSFADLVDRISLRRRSGDPQSEGR